MSDEVYCPENRHHVPRDQMTHIDTAKPGYNRPCCIACKDRIIEGREAAKKRLAGEKKARR